MSKLLAWISKRFELISLLFFLAFIPLYPKLPLIHVIRTWVYIRLEDVLAAVAIGIYCLIQLKKRKLPESWLTWPIAIYWGTGLITLIISILFIGPHLQGFFPHLAILHYGRRIEYMMFFFLAFTAIRKNRSALPAIIWLIAGTVAVVFLYGLGQKFLGFPAYLTMNEEFAKGIPLRLPPTARIPSTFGGHYDLAAFLVLMLPILGSIVFGMKKLYERFIFLILGVASLVLLLFTASRVSFIVYLISVTCMLVWQKKKLLIIPVIICSFILLNLVSGASDRFYKTFRFSNVIVDLSSGKPIGTLDKLEGESAVLQKSASPAVDNLPTGSEFINVPNNTNTSGTQKQVKTVEVVTNNVLANGSGEIATISGSFLIQKALVYDISITTRFQGEWPLAMEAFKRDVLFGSGFSTLSVATDGDYIRMLGETGIVGTISFLSILLTSFILFFKKKKTLPSLEQSFVIGFFGGLVGLMLNGILIDVFEASKVAFIFWLLLGVAVGLLTTEGQSPKQYLQMIWNVLTHKVTYVLYLFLFVILTQLRTLSWYFIGDDFTWLKWAAQSSTKDVLNYFTQSSGFFYRPIPKLWYFGLYSVFWLKASVYHFASLVLLAIATSLLYIIMRHGKVRAYIGLLLCILFSSLAIHHENIFWISGQSSLIAACLLFASIALWQRLWTKKMHFAVLLNIVGYFMLLGSMMSYDGMLIAPIIVCLVGYCLYKQSYKTLLPILLLIPIYWGLRVFSGAVMPSGDYGYKLATLPINVVANTIAYVLAIPFGPRVLEFMDSSRLILRIYKTPMAIGAIIMAILATFAIYKAKLFSKGISSAWIWKLCGLLSLLAYVGLGGVAERYTFVTSGFFIIAAATAIESLWKSQGKLAWKTGIVILFAVLSYWNITELGRLQNDWQHASDISQQSVLTIRQQFFPLDGAKAFIFINTPIRYGRAWIFPTGLNDAMWHMFRLNAYPYTIRTATSVDEAFSYPVGNAAPEILIFENNHLRRVAKHEITVPVDDTNNAQK